MPNPLGDRFPQQTLSERVKWHPLMINGTLAYSLSAVSISLWLCNTKDLKLQNTASNEAQKDLYQAVPRDGTVTH